MYYELLIATLVFSLFVLFFKFRSVRSELAWFKEQNQLLVKEVREYRETYQFLKVDYQGDEFEFLSLDRGNRWYEVNRNEAGDIGICNVSDSGALDLAIANKRVIENFVGCRMFG